MEIESYKLDIQWADRITDPDDHELKRQRAQDKRDGRKPPKQPIVPLVALRPPDVAAREHAAWLARATALTSPGAPEPRFHTRAQFSARLQRRS